MSCTNVNYLSLASVLHRSYNGFMLQGHISPINMIAIERHTDDMIQTLCYFKVNVRFQKISSDLLFCTEHHHGFSTTNSARLLITLQLVFRITVTLIRATFVSAFLITNSLKKNCTNIFKVVLQNL